MFKVNNRTTRRRCEIFSKLTIKTEERRRCMQFHTRPLSQTSQNLQKRSAKLKKPTHTQLDKLMFILKHFSNKSTKAHFGG